MHAKVTLDHAGRLVLPKAFRDALRIRPGDTLEIEDIADRIVISPARVRPGLQKEQGVWVYRSGAVATVSINDLIDRQQEQRADDFRSGKQ